MDLRYYEEYLRERLITDSGDLLRETESHESGLLEKEVLEMRPELDQLPEELTAETLDKTPMEDKILASRDEDFLVKELTPGEISQIVNKAVRSLPETFKEGDEVSDVCFDVAYAVMHQMTE